MDNFNQPFPASPRFTPSPQINTVQLGMPMHGNPQYTTQNQPNYFPHPQFIGYSLAPGVGPMRAPSSSSPTLAPYPVHYFGNPHSSLSQAVAPYIFPPAPPSPQPRSPQLPPPQFPPFIHITSKASIPAPPSSQGTGKPQSSIDEATRISMAKSLPKPSAVGKRKSVKNGGRTKATKKIKTSRNDLSGFVVYDNDSEDDSLDIVGDLPVVTDIVGDLPVVTDNEVNSIVEDLESSDGEVEAGVANKNVKKKKGEKTSSSQEKLEKKLLECYRDLTSQYKHTGLLLFQQKSKGERLTIVPNHLFPTAKANLFINKMTTDLLPVWPQRVRNHFPQLKGNELAKECMRLVRLLSMLLIIN